MPSSYPGGLDALSTGHVPNVQETIQASTINDLADAANKIEAELGIHPAGSSATVAARLDVLGGYVAALATRRRWMPEIQGASIIERFEAGHGWASTPGTGTINLNDTTLLGPLATQSVKVVNGSSGSSFFDKTVTSFDLTGKSLLVWVNYQGTMDMLATNPQVVVFAGDASLANNYSWTINSPTVVPESGWVCHELFVANASVTGSPPLSAIVKLRLRVNGAGAGGMIVSFGGVAIRASSAVYPNGVVSFTFDDSNASDFTLARPTLAKYGYAGTAYLIADQVGATGANSTALQYRQMQEELGWDIAGHAYTLAAHNTRYTNLTGPQLAAELLNLKQWLMTSGFRGESWASPAGEANQAVWVEAAKYFHTHRNAGVIISNYGLKQSVPVVRPHSIFASTWTAGTITVANIEAEIDKAKANKTWLVLNLHGITTGASAGLAMSTADLDTLAAYCLAQSVAVKTVSQVLYEAGLAA